MKKIVFVAATAIFFAACGGNGEAGKNDSTKKDSAQDSTKKEAAAPSGKDMLVGSWKLSDMTMNMGDMKLTEAQQKKMDENIEKLKKEASMVINADGTMSMNQSADQKTTAKWVLTDDGKSLITTDDKSSKVDTVGVEISANSVKMSLPDGKGSMTWTK